MSFFWIGIILFACGALLAYICRTFIAKRQKDSKVYKFGTIAGYILAFTALAFEIASLFTND